MILRLERKTRTNNDLGLVDNQSFHNLVDNTIKSTYRITDEEYDFVCEFISDIEFDDIFHIKESYTISEKRKILLTLQTIMSKFIISKNG